jgi:uncharacterized membrane protein
MSHLVAEAGTVLFLVDAAHLSALGPNPFSKPSSVYASSLCCTGFTVSFRLRGPVALTVVLLVCWAVAAATLLMLPVVWRPDKFAVPFSPITPAMGMFATVFLIGDNALSPQDTTLCAHGASSVTCSPP